MRRVAQLTSLRSGIPFTTRRPISKGPPKPTKEMPRKFQMMTCGAVEYLCAAKPGTPQAWADGLEASICWMQDAKYTSPKSKTSPYMGNMFPPSAQKRADEEALNLFTRYSGIIRNPRFYQTSNGMCTPPVGLIVHTTTKKTVPYFEGLLTQANIPKTKYKIKVWEETDNEIRSRHNENENFYRKQSEVAENAYDSDFGKLDRKFTNDYNNGKMKLPDGSNIHRIPGTDVWVQDGVNVIPSPDGKHLMILPQEPK